MPSMNACSECSGVQICGFPALIEHRSECKRLRQVGEGGDACGLYHLMGPNRPKSLQTTANYSGFLRVIDPEGLLSSQ